MNGGGDGMTEEQTAKLRWSEDDRDYSQADSLVLAWEKRKDPGPKQVAGSARRQDGVLIQESCSFARCPLLVVGIRTVRSIRRPVAARTGTEYLQVFVTTYVVLRTRWESSRIKGIRGRASNYCGKVFSSKVAGY